MRRVLVTGATGGLGRNAVTFLLSQGFAVRACGRRVTVGDRLSKDGAEFVACDLATSDFKRFQALVQGVDVVWHCAARTSPWGAVAGFMADNILATRNLLHAAGLEGVSRFVHISTPAIYFDFQNRHGIVESFCPRRYANHYAQTKALAEQEVLRAAQQYPRLISAILRPRAIFGPYDQVLIPRLARILSSRNNYLPIPRAGRAILDFTYVENVVHAMWLATTCDNFPSGEAFNITNHEPVALRTILHRLFTKALKRPFRIVPMPYPLMAAVVTGMECIARIARKEPPVTRYSLGLVSYDMILDNNKAKNILGYQPGISLEEGIQHTAEWMRRNG